MLTVRPGWLGPHQPPAPGVHRDSWSSSTATSKVFHSELVPLDPHPLVVTRLSGKFFLPKLSTSTYQTEFFPCTFPLDQASHIAITGSGTERGPGIPLGLSEKPGRSAGERRRGWGVSGSRLREGCPNHPCTERCSASAPREYISHSTCPIPCQVASHGLWEPGWPWIYDCGLKLGGAYRGAGNTVLSTLCMFGKGL